MRALISLVALGLTLLGLLGAGPVGAREPLDGARVYRDNCGRCHPPRPPSDLGPDAWKAVAFHMRVRANLTREETRALLEFLIPPPTEAEGAAVLLSHPVLAARCQLCHDPERIAEAVATGRTEAEWRETFERMRRYGATLGPGEAEALAAFLAGATP